MKMEFDKKYSFDSCGSIKTGRYQQTIGKDSDGEVYHLFIVDEGSRFYPVLITDNRLLAVEEQELYDLLSDPKQPIFFSNILSWHYKWKSK